MVLLTSAPTAVVQADEDTAGDVAIYMMRNAYHFATLYHAARAAQWELAAYQAEELTENLAAAERAVPTYAPLFQAYRRTYVEPLHQALTHRNAQQFRTAFQAAVQGCNDCHTATKHAFLVIPSEPPQLSIFALPPR